MLVKYLKKSIKCRDEPFVKPLGDNTYNSSQSSLAPGGTSPQTKLRSLAPPSLLAALALQHRSLAPWTASRQGHLVSYLITIIIDLLHTFFLVKESILFRTIRNRHLSGQPKGRVKKLSYFFLQNFLRMRGGPPIRENN